MSKGKKIGMGIIALVLLVVAIVVVRHVMYVKQLSTVRIEKRDGVTRYIGAEGVSFYSMVDTPNKVYTLMNTEGDTDAYQIAHQIYVIDKKTGKMNEFYDTGYSKWSFSGVAQIFGDGRYLGWEESTADNVSTVKVYDLDSGKVVANLKDMELADFYEIVDDTLHWKEQDNKAKSVRLNGN
ncbi:hypothetical protein HCB37_12675 [Listeria booriae]|uniref:hypothetical protein n=1 Tax=Listeria booriae TaxID=1552123 RepID=UPI00162ABCDE|nr:hypothetical protein [Listeria booriae]MBC1976551.1 hypothetical protein [Listeria booriae]MBC2034275.1 hypothetical protein [Listeria booriae]MBC2265362.1 hypothetical protein [Listeria booriae]